MLHVVWLLISVSIGHTISATLTSNDLFDDVPACQAYILDHRRQIPDYARGFFNLTLDDEVQVSSKCQADEKGA